MAEVAEVDGGRTYAAKITHGRIIGRQPLTAE